MSFYSRKSRRAIATLTRGGVPTKQEIITTTKVIDSATINQRLENITLTITPQTGQENPITFISATNSSNIATVQNVSVERLTTNPRFANVTAELVIPMQVTYVDANCEQFCSETQIVNPVAAVLYMPAPSHTPTDIVATASACVLSGTNSTTDPNALVVNIQLSQILKLVSEVDIVINSFGYATAPLAVTLNNETADFFTLPLYPE